MTMTASPTGLDSAQRIQLERIVSRARATLEADIGAQAEGRFGIHLDGTIEDEQALPDDASDRATRRDLVEIIDHIRSLGESQPEAVARLLREAAFTHLNRLLAIRIAEAIGLLPESLANGRQSRGFTDLGEIMPILGDDYWGYLLLCGDELAADAPALFDPRNPLLALAPSSPALNELLVLLTGPDAEDLWSAADTLGWAYQFFNAPDERRQMREEAAAPRTSRELAVRNQFFTPQYVVDFLVQNTLGRRLIEGDPTDPLLIELDALVDPPTEPGPNLDLADAAVLDPACGSGHFLLGCYDLLERAWQLRGVPPSESAPAVVASLWGIDIDSRCAQVASAAIVLRARRQCRELPLPRPSIVTARNLPGDSAALPPELGLGQEQLHLIDRISQVLTEAPLLGSLLKPEQALEQEIRNAPFGGAEGTLPVTADTFARAEADLMRHLQTVADQASSSVAERLLAADANDALRLIEVLRRRYDAVLMNPPYGLAPRIVEPNLKDEYPDGWTDLYAAFFYRGHQLLNEGGYLGALTSSQYFATRKQRALREFMTTVARPVAIVDLGSGVLQGAAVNTAATVLPKSRPSGTTAYVDLTALSADDRQAAVTAGLRSRVTDVDLAAFAAVDGCPFAFHASRHVESWATTARFEPGLAIVRTGNRTFDDFRFIRCRWEIDPRDIGTSWIPYEKGGTYRPYFSPSRLVLDWRNDGQQLRGLGLERGILPQIMQSSAHWYRAGLCFPRVNRGLGARVMPADEIFSEKANVVLPNPGVDPLVLMGVLNSLPVAALLQTFGRSRFIENGSVKALPISADQIERLERTMPEIVQGLVDVFRQDESLDETSAVFQSPFIDGADKESSIVGATARRNRAAQLQRQVDIAAESALDVPADALSDVDPRPELVASALMEPTAAESEWALRGISYVFGVAVGRWDVRLARGHDSAPEPGPFDPLPRCAPGMLVGHDGLPASEAPSGYPIEVAPAGLLTDEQGHPRDVEAAFMRAAAEIFDDSRATVPELLRVLRRKTVRDYLRKHFFKDHLARYSNSRRKAPIYWPLTVPSRNWGVWIYAPTLSRETLYAIASEAARRELLALEGIARLQRESHEGNLGRPARKIAEELDAEEKLTEELRRFRTEAERIAGLGWLPNLDDGIVLCAAPLAELFVAWPDAKKARDELRKGAHTWASVAKWAGEL
jgi:hypothetical protein